MAQTAETDRSTLRRVGFSSFIGAMIEWYDFFLYGQAAALVFGQVFFPGEDPLVGTLAAFATFAVGFGARPIGGVIFGHLGDRIGRKSALVATLFLMGIATFLIGCLPTHAAIGVWAPILLVVLRLLQGVAAGGEWGGAVLMLTEHAPVRRRGFYGAWPQMASSAALILATGLMYGMSEALGEEQFLTWGWRVPFLLSFLLIPIGIFIRLRIPESPEFERVKKAKQIVKRPVVDAVRTEWRSILLVIGMRVAENVCGYLVSVFALSYATNNLGLAASLGLLANMLAAGVQFVITPLYGALSDRIGRKPVYLLGAGLHIALAFPFFALVQTRSVPLILIAWVLGYAVANGALFATQPAFFSELFGTKVRYSGISIGYQFSAMIAGGLAPFVATGLVALAGGATWPVSLYWMAVGLITFVTTLLCRETAPVRTGLR
ncbi:MHS family MFS transporter [Pseudonocardia sp. DSM 110487]|uniref:MFS transporter n=1 Tax=Pseudonocardia sp. DSM 110487 TaxID=2865833 RepID=UPI001C6A7FAA|nr:MFS transporter [Pseudonocardia sp. DSM 110487]QYN37264.1 MHS family MFS transporter [Pseudonocardia sp. DSM 110487]